MNTFQRFIFLVFLGTFVIHSNIGMLIGRGQFSTMIQDELEQLGNDRTNLLSKVHPDLIQISIKGFKNDQEASKEEEIITGAKQIPVISDIERIKKVVEILEFVGEKVGVILENLQSAQTQTSSDYEPEKKIVEDIVPVTTAY